MVTATYPLTFPADAGTNTQWLTTNGSNAVSWTGGDSGRLVQRVSTITGAVATGTTLTPIDNTIPQNTEGNQYMSLAITPLSTTNVLYIDTTWFGADSVLGCSVLALFQDTTANALAVGAFNSRTAGGAFQIWLSYKMAAGTTSATTFKVRVGAASAGTITFNGAASARLFGGVACSGIIISEYAP